MCRCLQAHVSHAHPRGHPGSWSACLVWRAASCLRCYLSGWRSPRSLLVAGDHRGRSWGPGSAHRCHCGSAGLRCEPHLVSSPCGNHGGPSLRSHWCLSPNHHGWVRCPHWRSPVALGLHPPHRHCSRPFSQAWWGLRRVSSLLAERAFGLQASHARSASPCSSPRSGHHAWWRWWRWWAPAFAKANQDPGRYHRVHWLWSPWGAAADARERRFLGCSHASRRAWRLLCGPHVAMEAQSSPRRDSGSWRVHRLGPLSSGLRGSRGAHHLRRLQLGHPGHGCSARLLLRSWGGYAGTQRRLVSPARSSTAVRSHCWNGGSRSHPWHGLEARRHPHLGLGQRLHCLGCLHLLPARVWGWHWLHSV